MTENKAKAEVTDDAETIEGKESAEITKDTIVVDGQVIKQDGQFVKTGSADI